jgi:hypothetical protein
VAPEQRERGRFLAHNREHRLGAEAPGGPGGQPRLKLLAHSVEDLLEDGPAQLFFGLEMAIEDEAGDDARDVLHRSVREARSGERLCGTVDDRRTAFGAGEKVASGQVYG